VGIGYLFVFYHNLCTIVFYRFFHLTIPNELIYECCDCGQSYPDLKTHGCLKRGGGKRSHVVPMFPQSTIPSILFNVKDSGNPVQFSIPSSTSSSYLSLDSSMMYIQARILKAEDLKLTSTDSVSRTNYKLDSFPLPLAYIRLVDPRRFVQSKSTCL
jgi:hypothetical protein